LIVPANPHRQEAAAAAHSAAAEDWADPRGTHADSDQKVATAKKLAQHLTRLEQELG
jgi:hypothetical protein